VTEDRPDGVVHVGIVWQVFIDVDTANDLCKKCVWYGKQAKAGYPFCLLHGVPVKYTDVSCDLRGDWT